MLVTRRDSRANLDRLWAVVSDLPHWAATLPTFTSLTQVGGPEPVDVGSQFEAVQPRLNKAVWEVTAWDRGRGFTWSSRAPGVVTTATHVVEATATGSRLELGIEWTGPLSGLVRLMLSRRVQAMIDAEAIALASLAENDE